MKDCIMRADDKCIALKYTECPPLCRFYKNESMRDESVMRANRKLRRLPIEKQQDISIKYYDGYMPRLRTQEGR